MANILLGVTGSVAAVRTPSLYRALSEKGHAVKVLATDPALYFFDPAELPGGVLHVDADEWPRLGGTPTHGAPHVAAGPKPRGGGGHSGYQRGDPVLHIELRRWADVLLIAPLDANTLAKFVAGICDNCLTCVYRAWDPARPIVLAPAMNTFMWEHPLTVRHLRQLIADHGGGQPPANATPEELVAWLNDRPPRLKVIGPITKQLACEDVGMGAMAEVAEIVAAVPSG
jgi:phosphopantothenoylcysteine decarboxylase